MKHFGIDISHLVFDVTDYYQFKNNIIGFKKFLKRLDLNSNG